MSRAAYWRAVATALQGQITQAQVVQDQHRTPIWVMEYAGTGQGAPRFMATTAADRPGWQPVARVDTDGTVRPIREGAPS